MNSGENAPAAIRVRLEALPPPQRQYLAQVSNDLLRARTPKRLREVLHGFFSSENRKRRFASVLHQSIAKLACEQVIRLGFPISVLELKPAKSGKPRGPINRRSTHMNHRINSIRRRMTLQELRSYRLEVAKNEHLTREEKLLLLAETTKRRKELSSQPKLGH